MSSGTPPRAREISRATLLAQIGRAATWSIVGFSSLPRYQSARVLIPDFEQLEIGDVILTRKKRVRWWNIGARLIERVQRNYKCVGEACVWTHATLYVGDLHVIEANKSTDFRRGIWIRPLTYFKNHDLLVLRLTDPTFDFAKRQRMARHALLENTIFRRRYDVRTALAALLKGQPPAKRHDTHVNCSEFILQGFMEAGFFVKEYFETVTMNRFFYPAHLLELPGFTREEMQWFRFVHPPEHSEALVSAAPEVAPAPGN
jgi:hypothetical protein